MLNCAHLIFSKDPTDKGWEHNHCLVVQSKVYMEIGQMEDLPILCRATSSSGEFL